MLPKTINDFVLVNGDSLLDINLNNLILMCKKNFYSIGRQGQFYYGDIDQMIRIGFDTADKIMRD